MTLLISIYFRDKFFTLLLVIVGFCLFTPFQSQSQQINTYGLDNIGRQISFFEDSAANLNINEVKRLTHSVFKPGKTKILNFGNTSSAWWIKLNYTSPAQVPLHLLIDAPNIENVSVFTTDEHGNPIKYETGSLAKEVPNVSISNNFLINLPVSKETENKSIYLRLKSNNILLVPIKIATIEDMFDHNLKNVGIEYIYIGLLIGLLLYNLFLFFSIKDHTYLYYVMYVFTLSCYILMYLRGYAYLWGDDFRIFFNLYPHIFMGLSLISLLVFSHQFLNLNKTLPQAKKAFYLVGLFGIILLILSVLGYKQMAANFTQVLSFVSTLIIWFVSIVSYRRGHKPAKYFIIAWFLIWMTSTIVTFSFGGLLVQNEFTIQLVPLSTIVELLILSFALGDRYKLTMQTEQALRDENIRLIKTQNQLLEERVEERTHQLSLTIRELEDSNAIKNKLFSIIAHDLKSPLNSLMGILSLNDMNALNETELKNLLSENKKTFDSINNTLNNLLHWAKNQMNGMVTEKKQFNLNNLFEDLILSYLPLVQKKKIKIIKSIENDAWVWADENQINLVLRNLIDNAIKFTPIGGKINISIQPGSNGIIFFIENEIENGQNIELDSLRGEKLSQSTIGTQNEQGVGLGLLLCQEYLKNNGSLLQNALEGNRLKFSFTLRVNP